MLLEKNFYTVQSFTNEEGIAKASISINAAHEIFKGHFPGQPVVPGVCMTQIVKELLEKAITKETRLLKADHLKFLSVINSATIDHLDCSSKNHKIKSKLTKID